jgi:hypothetical protein
MGECVKAQMRPSFETIQKFLELSSIFHGQEILEGKYSNKSMAKSCRRNFSQ